jgi:catechol 2,3-dioxygenase-like lactoylglutathione lyase family enzyme
MGSSRRVCGTSWAASRRRCRSVAIVITGVHTLVYADDAAQAREFFRDVLGWPNVDAHEGWLIFGTGPSELGVHPSEGAGEHHEISLVCDDIQRTVAELTTKGAQFEGGIEQRGFGLTIALVIPGAGQMLLYEPRHPTAFDL